MVTPERPRTASRSVSGSAIAVASTVPVNAESPSNRIESICDVWRLTGAVPEVNTNPAQPALPGLLTDTVSPVFTVKVLAPQNRGSPETCSDVPSCRK